MVEQLWGEKRLLQEERDRYKQERDDLLLGLTEKIDQGQWHRYKRERDELLQALFQPVATRKILAQMILGDQDSQQVDSPESLRESDGSRGKALGDSLDR